MMTLSNIPPSKLTPNQRLIQKAILKGDGKIPFSPRLLKSARILKEKGLITYSYTTKMISLKERTQTTMYATVLQGQEMSEVTQLYEGTNEEICPHCGQVFEVGDDDTEATYCCAACGRAIR